MFKLFRNRSAIVKPAYQVETIDESMLAEINGLKVNGPTVPLKADEIHVRSMYCMGESPTSKMSIHPDGMLNGKDVKVLSTLAPMMLGAPMMEGHRFDKIPWARIFRASVVDRDGEKVIKASYYFLSGIDKYEAIAREIDAGIRSEGSISYGFTKAACSICHTSMKVMSFFGMTMTRPGCDHKVGERYGEDDKSQVCYWYPQPESIKFFYELSHVFRGAYPKTGVAKNAEEFQAMYDEQGESVAQEYALDRHVKLWQGEDIPEANTVGVNADPSGSDSKSGHHHDSKNPKGVHRHGKSPDVKDGGHSHENGTNGEHTHPWSVSEKDGKHMHDGSNPHGLHSHKAKEATSGKNCECGKPLTDDEMKCSHCGKEVAPAATAPQPCKCEKCIKEIEKPDHDQVKFCDECALELPIEQNRLFTPAGPVKPAKSGTINNEFFKLDDFKNLEGDYFVEPKYDGVWMELHRGGDKVKLYTGEGNEHSAKFPGIVKDARSEKSDKFIIAGEMIKMRGKQRLGHEDVTAHLQSKDAKDDSAFRYKVFDVMESGGEDLRSKPLSERKEKLNAVIDNTDQIQKTKLERVSGGDKLPAKIEEIASREGSMIKDVTTKYSKNGEKGLFKWKRQFEVDGKVSGRTEKEGGGFVYTVEVGRGDKAQEIGKTFATSVEANKGDIVRVSVDKVTVDEDGKFTWFAPKVLNKRSDKTEADPISTLEKIAVKKGEGEPASKNYITLSEVVPCLMKHKHDYPLYLCGGIVEKGISTNDVDVLVKTALTDEQREALLNCLPEDWRERLDIMVDLNGPAGPWIEIAPESSERYAKNWKNANKFVMQKHWWGNKAHWDLRFGAPKAPRMWGWTCFTEPSKTAGGPKVRCQEKKYHDPKWLDFNGDIQVGEPGNPTKNLVAHMKIVDKGDYKFVVRKPKFLEMVLDGEKFKGRYVWREIAVKADKSNRGTTDGDEAGVKSENIWVLWKTKDQKPSTDGGKVNKIAWRYDEHGTFLFWETDEPDLEAFNAPAS